MAYDHTSHGRVCYWPARHRVDAAMTPNEAWAAVQARTVTLDEFWQIIGVWST